MKSKLCNIVVSGLVNVETTLNIGQFPVQYCPIEYRFFGLKSNVAGVAYNVTKALVTLENNVELLSMIGTDGEGKVVLEGLKNAGISDTYILPKLHETPTSLILFDDEGKRKIYCDLKDIQESDYPMENAEELLENCDLVVACNCNFNRPLLKLAKEMGKTIATDVHVLSDLNDDYNRDFMKYGDIVFLSDEIIVSDNKNPWDFLREMYTMYSPKVIVLGRGSKGALMYLGEKDEFVELAAVKTNDVVNTVGAGDALFSAFVHFYAQGMEPAECLKRAQIFASLKIAHNGAALGFESPEKIESWYEKIYG